MEKCYLSWEDFYSLYNEKIKPIIAQNPDSNFFGVPRGGSIIAALTGKSISVSQIDNKTIIVDDIADSGKTRQKYKEKFGRPFVALVDKSTWSNSLKNKWIVFPWEAADTLADLEDTVIRQLEFINENPNRPGLKDTPKRYLKSLAERTKGYNVNIEELIKHQGGEVCFEGEACNYDEMIVVKNIEFCSTCEHHLLPFMGVCSFGYLPKNHEIVGLSKIPRLVEAFASRLQVQERLTTNIADAFDDIVKPRGVGVVIEAVHSCVQCRGANKRAPMLTSCLRGEFLDSEVRLEFFSLLKS